MPKSLLLRTSLPSSRFIRHSSLKHSKCLLSQMWWYLLSSFQVPRWYPELCWAEFFQFLQHILVMRRVFDMHFPYAGLSGAIISICCTYINLMHLLVRLALSSERKGGCSDWNHLVNTCFTSTALIPSPTKQYTHMQQTNSVKFDVCHLNM